MLKRLPTLLAVTITLGGVGCDSNKNAGSAPAATTAAAGAKAAPAPAAAAAPTTPKPQAAAPGAPGAPGSQPAAAGELPFEATGPVARVNGVEVSAKRYNEEVRRLTSRMPPGMAGRYKDRVLESLVSDTIVEQALTTLKVTVSDEEMTAEFDKFTKDLAKRGPGGLEAFYARAKTNEAEFKGRMRKSLLFMALLAKKGHSIEVTDAEAKAFYDKNADRFTHEEQVKASHILLKLEADAAADADADPAKAAEVEKKAKELVALAKAPGADFAALAKKHSQGPSAPKGGDLGFFEKSKMVPPFANAAWAMKVGEVSAPVKTRFGYHVIKVTDRQAKGSTPLAEAKGKIVRQLESQKRRAASQTLVSELRKAAKVENMPENIKVNIAETPRLGIPGMPGMPGVPGVLRPISPKSAAPKPAPPTTP